MNLSHHNYFHLFFHKIVKMLAFNRYNSRQSFQPDAIISQNKIAVFDSAIKKTQQFNVGIGASSHVNIHQIPEYKEVKHMQRPLTGKQQRNQSAVYLSSAGVQSAKVAMGFVGIGPLQSQVFKRNQRMTSAQGVENGYVRSSKPILSNTREILMSQSTMAGSNHEFISANCRSRQSLAAQMSSLVHQSTQAIVRQHYMVPNAVQSQHMTQAKAQHLRNSTSFAKNNNASRNSVSKLKRPSASMKAAARTLKNSAQQRKAFEMRGVAPAHVMNNKVVSPPPDQKSALNDVFEHYKQGQRNALLVENLVTNEIDDDLGDNSKDREHSDQKPLDLAIDSTAMLHKQQHRRIEHKNPFQKVAAKAIVNSLAHVNGRKHQQRRSSNSRHAKRRAIVYNLPDVSQGLLESNVLPRSTQYMRRLYSIAHKREQEELEKEKAKEQVEPEQPKPSAIRQRKIRRLEMTPSPNMMDLANEGGANDTFVLSQDLISANGTELARQRVSTEQREASSKDHRLPDRSQSLVQLHVKNVQFPFDSQIQGGFSRQKQLEMKMSAQNRDLNCSPLQKSERNTIEHQRRRPQTAGRVGPIQSNIDLFSNKLISQVAAKNNKYNRLSSKVLSSNQQTSEIQIGTVDVTQSATYLAATDQSSKDQNSIGISFQNPANMTTEQYSQLQFANLQSQFANVMFPQLQQQILIAAGGTLGQDAIVLRQSQILDQLLMMKGGDQLLKSLSEMPMPLVPNANLSEQKHSSNNVTWQQKRIDTQDYLVEQSAKRSRRRATSPNFKKVDPIVSVNALSSRNQSSRLPSYNQSNDSISRRDNSPLKSNIVHKKRKQMTPENRQSARHSMTITVARTSNQQGTLSSKHDTNLLQEQDDNNAPDSSNQDLLTSPPSIQLEVESNQRDTQAQVDFTMLQDTVTTDTRMLVLTDMPPQSMRQIVMSHDTAQSPFNNLYQPEKMQPIKIKSVFFDKNGQRHAAQSKNGSPQQHNNYEQSSHYSFAQPGSPSRFLNPSQLIHKQNSQSSSQQYRGSLYKSDRQKQQQNNLSPQDLMALGENVNEHKHFVVTQPIKRRASNNTAHKNQQTAQLRGRKMRLQSAKGRHSQNHRYGPCAKSQSNLDIQVTKDMQENHELLYADVLGNETSKKAVPPLALPTEVGTEFINSQNFVSESISQAELAAQQEKQKILSSFSQNNVRTNLRGSNVQQLIQGIEFGSPGSFGSDQILQSSAGQISPLRKHKYMTHLEGKFRHQASNSHPNEFTPASSERVRNVQQVEAATQELVEALGNAIWLPESLQNVDKAKDKSKVVLKPKQQKNEIATHTQRLQQTERIDSPIPTLRVDKDDPSKQVIQETMPEREQSPQHSRIRVSVSSQRKGKAPAATHAVHNEQMPTSITGGDEAQSSRLCIILKDSQDQLLLKKTQQSISEAADSADVAVSGIISVYEAEKQALKSGLIKAYSGGRSPGVERRGVQLANIDLQQFLQKHSMFEKDDQVQILGIVSQSGEKDIAPENLDTEGGDDAEINSPIHYTRLSSLGINFTGGPGLEKDQISTAKKVTKSRKQKNQQGMTLIGHQLKSHQILEAAKNLINDARVLKLDAEVINKQLLELFRNKQDTKNLDKMMKEASLELNGSITDKLRIAQGMTNQQSSSSLGGGEIDNIVTLVPTSRLAPNSPESTPVNEAKHVIIRPTVAIGGINQGDKSDLPTFGAESSMEQTKKAHIIDFTKNIMPQASLKGQSLTFKEPAQKSPVTKVRPYSANCQAGRSRSRSSKLVSSDSRKIEQHHKGVTQLSFQKPQSSHDWYETTQPQHQSQAAEQVTTFRQMATIKEGVEENLEQPYWARQKNLKSKFNLMTMAQQAGQAQRFKIDFQRERSESPDRIPTANMQTITQLSPTNLTIGEEKQLTVKQKKTKGMDNARLAQKQIQIQLLKHQQDAARQVEEINSRIVDEGPYINNQPGKKTQIISANQDLQLCGKVPHVHKLRRSHRNLIEKVKDQGYVSRSRARNHFSLTQSMIKGTQKNSILTQQNIL